MRSSTLRLVTAVLASCQILAMAGCLSAVQSQRERIEFEGRARAYRVHVPPSHEQNKPVPLVIALHGADMGPILMAYLTKFNKLSDREGFVVVYPKGLHKRWNSGLNAPGFPGYDEPVDDVGFVAKIIEDVERDYRIDPRRVYVTGASNGGMLTHMVACRLADTVAAVAPVIGTMAENAAPDCKPSRPIPILMINSTKDPLVKWEGGALLKNNQGRALSVDATVDFWVQHNGCAPAPDTEWLPHNGPRHGTSVRRDLYKGETRDGDVILYTVEGGGHTWPGGALIQAQWSLGHVNRDLNATEVIWQFFKKHPR